MFLVVVAGRCWYEKSRLNIHYYPNRRHKSYVTSLKAAIVGKSLISAELDIIEFWISFFMIKYSKFTDNIGTGNFTDPSCQNTDKFQNRAGAGSCTPHMPPHTSPLDTPLSIWQLAKCSEIICLLWIINQNTIILITWI